VVSTLLRSDSKHRLPHLVCGKCSPLLTPRNIQHIFSGIMLIISKKLEWKLSLMENENEQKLLKVIKHSLPECYLHFC